MKNPIPVSGRRDIVLLTDVAPHHNAASSSDQWVFGAAPADIPTKPRSRNAAEILTTRKGQKGLATVRRGRRADSRLGHT